LVTDTYSGNPRVYLNDGTKAQAPAKTLLRIQNNTSGHIANFVDGILDGVKTSSPFSIAGPLTESVLMGNLAVRAFQYKQLKPGKTATDWAPYNYPGRTRLNWDGEAMKITNYKPANAWVGREYRQGWEI
jgi:hypothetical protein